MFEQLAVAARALSSAARLELLDFLAQGERNVEELAQAAELSVANTSKHLQHLKAARLGEARRDGKHIGYRLADDRVLDAIADLRMLAEAHLDAVGDLLASYLRSRDAMDPVPAPELLERTRDGLVTLIDVRPPEEYAQGHIRDALNIPLDKLETHLQELPPDREIVVYCRGPWCVPSFEAVARVRNAGIEARRSEDGLPEWRRAGLPVENRLDEQGIGFRVRSEAVLVAPYAVDCRLPPSIRGPAQVLPPIAERIARQVAASTAQVDAAIGLLDGGATVPFIARYRKEVTGGLDDAQLRTLEERLGYLRELEDRRGTVLKSIDEQGKLTDGLKADLLAAETKTALEDLYLPYKPKRRTKAQIAREAGIAPLVESLLADPTRDPQALAADYLNEEAGFADAKAVLDGARQILMEQWAEDPQLSGEVREWLWENAALTSRLVEGKEKEGAKFSDYFEFSQLIRDIPSHRALALFRARNEGIVHLDLEIEEDAQGRTHPERLVAQRFEIRDRGRAADAWLRECVRFTWRIKLLTRLDLELKTRLREAAEAEAIKVFAANLHDLLLAAPAGPRVTIGLDPGLRTGVKVAVLDATGKVVATDTIYPHPPKKQWDQSIAKLARLAQQHHADLVAIGNGTASRETDKLAAELCRKHPELKLRKIMVSEAGASVYSASELASNELPNLDVSLRGAVSIARRLQDPLAELVKIDPKSIGVGQYQHDVSQLQLARSLDNVVEDCVNAVGVDVNTASPALLRRVSGLSESVADNIVQFRDQHGAFADRRQLKQVPRLGEKTFEQAAGFLRVMNGSNPLDASAVHPEAYPVVERILAKSRREMGSLIGDGAFLRSLQVTDYTDERFGAPTVKDIIGELEKPGRDPRPRFKTAAFQDGVETLADLEPNMVLEGVITNVTNFGAFVDIGVHQDGLVHISAMSDKFIKDPRELVKAGAVVKVKVMEVDLDRKRIALSMRLSDEPGKPAARPQREPRNDRQGARRQQGGQQQPKANNAFADAFTRARKR